MKFSEIVEKYDLDETDFDLFVLRKDIPCKRTFSGRVFDDSKVEEIVAQYRESIAMEERKKAEEAELAAQAAIEEEIKNKAMAKMLITSGFNFDGYRIVKYSGYISGDDAISVDRGYAWERKSIRDELMASLVTIRRNALRELKEAAYDLGCNAVIGVDFDYLTLDPQTANASGGTTYQPYIFGVTANGNAVIIEKIED